MRTLLIGTLICLFGCTNLLAAGGGNDPAISIEDYIATYAQTCVNEMESTGIPASIKMAQAILESRYGNSELSLKSNNHFGIKCHKGWTGEKVYHDDDAKGECFRKYTAASQSFTDHSEFLTTRNRYAFLFELGPTDYVAWANGLKQAGYATNPKYPQLLINLIEKHNLAQLDIASSAFIADKSKPVIKEPAAEPVVASSNTYNPNMHTEIVSQSRVLYMGNIVRFNNKRAYVAHEGDTYNILADAFVIPKNKLFKYNDIEKNEELRAGDKVYLQPKAWKGNEETHVVMNGESMHDIAQMHGLKVKSLKRYNRLEDGQMPASGETINLKKKRDTRPKLIDEIDYAEAPKKGLKKLSEKLKFGKKEKVEKPMHEAKSASISNSKKSIGSTNNDSPAFATYYKVKQGDTLYSISKNMKIDLEQLKKDNELAGNDISPGQMLKIVH